MKWVREGDGRFMGGFIIMYSTLTDTYVSEQRVGSLKANKSWHLWTVFRQQWMSQFPRTFQAEISFVNCGTTILYVLLESRKLSFSLSISALKLCALFPVQDSQSGTSQVDHTVIAFSSLYLSLIIWLQDFWSHLILQAYTYHSLFCVVSFISQLVVLVYRDTDPPWQLSCKVLAYQALSRRITSQSRPRFYSIGLWITMLKAPMCLDLGAHWKPACGLSYSWTLHCRACFTTINLSWQVKPHQYNISMYRQLSLSSGQHISYLIMFERGIV